MKKDYNRNTMADMPLDAGVQESSVVQYRTKTSKPKINAIGKKANDQIKNRNKKSINNETNKSKQKNVIELSDDLERLNEENIKAYQVRSKRSKVAIVLLVIMLVLAVTILTVYLSITKLQINCKMNVTGAEAVYIVDGNELSEFRAPSGLVGNATLELDIKLTIKESGYFNIRFKPECYQNGILMNNTVIYDANIQLFKETADGYYVSIQPIEGNQTIRLCGGVCLDEVYRNTLNVNNFKMDFNTYLEKI